MVSWLDGAELWGVDLHVIEKWERGSNAMAQGHNV